MPNSLPFTDVSNCPKGPITLWEVIVEALGSIDGQTGVGETAAGTQLAHFNAGSSPIAFNMVDDTGGGSNNVVPAFTGSFPDNALLDRDLLPEDILIKYRITDDCGTGEFFQITETTDCDQPTGAVAVTLNIMEEGHYHFDLNLNESADYIIFEIRRGLDNSLLGTAKISVGDNVLTTVSDDVNWISTGDNDGNIATYLTPVTNVLLTEGDLLGAGWSIDFDKLQFMIDRGFVDPDDNNTELILTISPGNDGCEQPVNDYTDTIPEAIFADVFIPFVGKQTATPVPEIEWDGSAPNCGNNWGGLGVRNGSMSGFIDEIRIDHFTDLTINRTANSGTSVLFPLSPITDGDGAANPCGPANPTPAIGFDDSAILDDNVVNIAGVSPNFTGEVLDDFTCEIDYSAGTVAVTTIVKGFIGFAVSSDDDQATWNFGISGNWILIARGDALVYGTVTTGTIGNITFHFNVNDSHLGSNGGASSWVTQEIRVADTPGPAPGSYTTYGNIMTNNGSGTPAGTSRTTNIAQTHNFSAVGLYKVFIEVETDNAYNSTSELWVGVSKY